MTTHSFRIVCLVALGLCGGALTPAGAALDVRIKDIARIAGLEPVEVIGYGIVVGLNGTGDKDLKLTKQTMANLFENFQISLATTDIKSKNVAAVIVTATIPGFHSEGDRVDIHVSSVGDATSLLGGQLLMTPLLDADGKVYALAQGSLTVGGYHVGAKGMGGETVSKNVATSGTVPSGATLRYGRTGTFHENGMLKLVLRRPDFTTAQRTVGAILHALQCGAVAKDAGTILVEIPQASIEADQIATFIASLEALTVKPDTAAKVIVNERTGTIVMGQDVHIAPAVVAHGVLTVTIKSTPVISQPNAFSPQGQTATAEDVSVRVNEPNAKIVEFKETVSVQDLMNAMKNLGVATSDMISILEALANAGALQMEVVSM